MSFLDDLTLGRYHAADSLLHRLDPRLKLIGLPLLVIASFAGAPPLRLLVLFFVAILFLGLGKIPVRLGWRGIRALRWLLLFTLLMHFFFTPGRTLFGQAWLSWDGLLHGLQVDAQLILAVTFSSLLTLTTAPREIAAALSALLMPLRRWLPVRQGVLLFLLVLQFIPMLREEAAAACSAARRAGCDPDRGPLPDRVRNVAQLLAPLLLRLTDRADALARAAARGEDVWGEADMPVLRTRPGEGLVMAGGLIGLALIFGIL
ncbi:MAG: energy-coupling factor transporter transmembrane protein EcfT [Desulfuromonadales bacterium]